MDIDALINQITSLQIGLDAIDGAIERSGDPGGALKLVRDSLREMIKALKSLLEKGPEGHDWETQGQGGSGSNGDQRGEPAATADDAAGIGVEIVIGAIGHLIGGIIGGIVGSAAPAPATPAAEEEFPGKWVDGSYYKAGDTCFRVEWLAIDGMIKARVRPVPCNELS